MAKLVFARHGESEWNKANLFTGWADVDLSEKGVQQAIDAGKLIKEAGIEFDVAFTSVLKRAIKTTNLALENCDQLWVPVEKSWRLNERHYGGLTGKNKAEAAAEFEKLPIVEDAALLRNILYSGVWSKFTALEAKQKTRSKGDTKQHEQ